LKKQKELPAKVAVVMNVVNHPIAVVLEKETTATPVQAKEEEASNEENNSLTQTTRYVRLLETKMIAVSWV
jgi:hypothetical protein